MENNSHDKNIDINMAPDNLDVETEISSKRKNLYTELTEFLKAHTVYETIPENMKVIILYKIKKRF